jgi:hypothetical protein
MNLAIALLLAGQPWTRHTIDNSSRGADGVKLIDINGDGRPDVTTAWEEGGAIRVYYNEGRVGVRSEWPRVTVGNVSSPEDAVFADLDSDLAFDVVSACEGDQRALFIHWAPKSFDRYFDPAAWVTTIIPASRDRMMWMFAVLLILAAGMFPLQALLFRFRNFDRQLESAPFVNRQPLGTIHVDVKDTIWIRNSLDRLLAIVDHTADDQFSRRSSEFDRQSNIGELAGKDLFRQNESQAAACRSTCVADPAAVAVVVGQ